MPGRPGGYAPGAPQADGRKPRGAGWDGYAGGCTQKARHEYRRQARRFADAGGTVELVVARVSEGVVNDTQAGITDMREGITRAGEGLVVTGGDEAVSCEAEKWMAEIWWPTAPRPDSSGDATLARSHVDGRDESTAEPGARTAETDEGVAATTEDALRDQQELLGGAWELEAAGTGGSAGVVAAAQAAMKWPGDFGGNDETRAASAAAGTWRVLEARVRGERAGMLLVLARAKRQYTGGGGSRGYRGATDPCT